MNKFVIIFALVASAFAEPPSHYGQPQYEQVQYASPSYTAYEQPATYEHVSTGYSGGGSDGSEYVDDALLARIAQILEQHEGGSSSFSSGGYSSGGYETSSGYGVPAQSSGGGGVLIGRPERAQRIAEFDLTDHHQSNGGYSSGGYSSGGY